MLEIHDNIKYLYIGNSYQFSCLYLMFYNENVLFVIRKNKSKPAITFKVTVLIPFVQLPHT